MAKKHEQSRPKQSRESERPQGRPNQDAGRTHQFNPDQQHKREAQPSQQVPKNPAERPLINRPEHGQSGQQLGNKKEQHRAGEKRQNRDQNW